MTAADTIARYRAGRIRETSITATELREVIEAAEMATAGAAEERVASWKARAEKAEEELERMKAEALRDATPLEVRAAAMGTSRGHVDPRRGYTQMGPSEYTRPETDAEMLVRVERLEGIAARGIAARDPAPPSLAALARRVDELEKAADEAGWRACGWLP